MKHYIPLKSEQWLEQPTEEPKPTKSRSMPILLAALLLVAVPLALTYMAWSQGSRESLEFQYWVRSFLPLSF